MGKFALQREINTPGDERRDDISDGAVEIIEKFLNRAGDRQLLS